FGAAGIAYRWEPDLKLVVAADREQEVDALVDDIRGEPSDPEGDELTPASDEWGEGEDAFAALGNLYDAADRLFHAPANIRAGLDLRAATKAVRDAPPPFGFNAVLWQTAGELGSRLSALLDEGASSEDVQAGAEALRDVLAEHI